MSANFNFYLNRQGAKGRKGDQGEQGYSPSISVETNTASEYVLKIQNEGYSFTTPNLRGNAIENTGGTYIRYNPDTEQMYTGGLDLATVQGAGAVMITPTGGIAAGGSTNDVPTSAEVYDYVESRVSEQGLNFDRLATTLVEGSNITLDVDSENETITINSSGGDLSNYVTLNTEQTLTAKKTSNITRSGSNIIYNFEFAGGNNANLTIGSVPSNNSGHNDIPVIIGNKLRIGTTESNIAPNFVCLSSSTLPSIGIFNITDAGVSTTDDSWHPIFSDLNVTFGTGLDVTTSGVGQSKKYTISATSNITVDTALSLTSTNPVQNAIITQTINGITELIPAQASVSNQLADKTFVNSSIATNTANFIGTFNSVADLEAYSGTVTNNDYAFVIGQDATGNTTYSRYKYNANNSTWNFEYVLNNSSFTAVQWASINSGITTALVNQILTNQSDILGKEDTANKVTSISSSSTNTEYPTAKCVYDNLGTKLDTDLSNLSAQGNKKLHAVKGYYEELNSLNDEEGYNYYKNNLRTTFDLSKFDVVGSPIITDDGIASGFSSGNYLKSPVFTLTQGQELKIKGQFNAANYSSQFGTIIELYDVVNNIDKVQFGVSNVENQLMFRYPTSETTSSSAIFNLGNIYYGQNYDFEIVYEGTTLFLYINKTPIYSIEILNNYIASTYYVTFGFDTSRNGQPLIGSINLKQSSTTVDSAEVFSGNKTGIDTYTINNSTISIPYIETIQGDRIADIQYLTQAQQIYEATGNCDEVILDQVNQVYYLPAGSIYGKINRTVGNIETILNNINSGSGS